MQKFEALSRFVEPMLISPTRAVPEGDQWVIELNWDGCRVHLVVDGGPVLDS